MKRLCFVLAGFSLAIAASTSPIFAGPKIEIVIGPDAPKLTRFAAEEMSGQLKMLFDAEVTVSNSIGPDATNVILLGQPDTNPALAKAIGADWPKLSDQGIFLKSIGPAEKRMLVVGGGSPVATLWAAYELGHRYGIRYMLSGDTLPATPKQFTLDKFDILLEPTLKTRGWRLMRHFEYISTAWGLADQQRLVHQLAKLKFNRLVLDLQYDAPFIDYEFRGAKTSSARAFQSRAFPVGGDTPGRKAFKGEKEFANPDFAGKASYSDIIATGKRLVSGLMDTAHDLGMSAAIQMSPLLFPHEFAGVLPQSKDGLEGLERKLGAFSVHPGNLHKPEDLKILSEAIGTHIQACLTTYPTTDALYLALQFDQDSKAFPFLADEIKSPLLALPGNRRIEVTFCDMDATVDENWQKLAQRGANYHFDLDLKPSDLQSKVDLILIRNVRGTITLPLTHSYLGVLPQTRIRRTHQLVTSLRKQGWSGFVVEGPMVGDLDPLAFYLSRAGFDSTMTPDASCHELFDTICGSSDVADRLIKGFDFIEQADDEGDAHWDDFTLLGAASMHLFGFTDLDDPKSASASKKVSELYLQAMNEMFRAHDNCNPSARRYVYYYARRCEFAMQYMNYVQSLYAAGVAKKRTDKEARLEQLGKAVEALYNGLNCLGDVARDQSDRGAIAVLTEFAYRPLVKQLDKETEESEKGQ